ncbi:MAG TPA: flavodoxin family protein [Methanocella sp.]|nr:flavodoxin family protein [Methanocella sp.]
MKIVAINGSHRGERGFTQFLLEKLAVGAYEAGAEVEIVVLARHQINQCTGCQICHTDGSYLECVYGDGDDVKSIFDRMRKADILIFATPVYLFGISSLLKRFLERINSTGDSDRLRVSKSGLVFHHIDRELCSKPFALLVTCDNLEDETPRSVISYFTAYSRFMDAPIVGTLIRKNGVLVGHGKSSELEQKYPRIQGVYEAYMQAGRELATSGRISGKTMWRANRHILDVPLLGLLLKLKPIKGKMIERAKI